jgi:hypothetical protein
MEMGRMMILVTLMAAARMQDYTLELDWAVSSAAAPSSSQLGYVTWNDQTLLVLTQSPNSPAWHHETTSLTFTEGPNQLGLYFLGLSGSLVLDNIAIRKGSSSINYVLNGDFEMCQLADGEQLHVFSGKIAGWSAPQITIRKVVGGGSQVVLTTPARSVTQSISFGKVSNYQFLDSINAAIQTQAKNIISSNLQTIALNNNPIWNTSFLQNRPLLPTTTTPSAPAPSTQPTNAQSITAQVSQLLQLAGSAPKSLLGL